MINKRLVFAIILSVIVLSCLFACNVSSSEEAQTLNQAVIGDEKEELSPNIVDSEAVYGDVLKEIYDVIVSFGDETEIKDGMYGVYMASMALDDAATDTIGYVFLDLNEDGIDELLVGCFEKPDSAQLKNELYAVYTYDGQKAVQLLEGVSRSAYSLTDTSSFYYYGSSGAAYSIFGEFELTSDGKLSCRDYYFTHEKNGDFSDIGFFYNNTGEWDIQKSQELDIDSDAFYEIQNDLSKRTVSLSDEKFSSMADN